MASNKSDLAMNAQGNSSENLVEDDDSRAKNEPENRLGVTQLGIIIPFLTTFSLSELI